MKWIRRLLLCALLAAVGLASTACSVYRESAALLPGIEFGMSAAQAKAVQVILPSLSDEEHAVFRRGRNARVSGIPKGCTIEEYHHATAFEALFGWLYLCGRQQRLNELFDIIAKGWENGT